MKTSVWIVAGLGAALVACGSNAGESGSSAGSGGESSSSGAGSVGGAGPGSTSTSAGAGGGGVASAGCGKAPGVMPGGVNVTIDAGAAGGGQRRFFLSLPKNYDPKVPHKLILGFPGTNWVGEQIQPYFELESAKVTPRDDEIFLYPDPQWHDFVGWGNLGGWLLGPNAAPADGDTDLVFVKATLDYMKQNYCIDPDRVFATGHSWGGDFAMVVSCFLGAELRAAVPVAANEPYWFRTGNGVVTCQGKTAVWVMFGKGDDHFTSQMYPGEYGDECRDFWLDARKCAGAMSFTDLGIGSPGECVEYQGCADPVRYCLYDPKYAHQIPSDYFAAETMKFFRSF